MADPIAKPKPYWAPPGPTVIPPWVPIPATPDTSIARTSRSTLGKTKKKQSETQATVAGAGSCVPIAYGYQRLGGKIFVCLVRASTLYLGVAWCRGEIDAIVKVEINDDVPPSQGVDITNYTGTDTQATDPTLANIYRSFGKTYDDDLQGIAYSVIRVQSSARLSGFPRVNAIVRGMKVRTAADSARVYSQVGAYIVADFIESSAGDDGYGMGELVDWDSVQRVAALNTSIVGGEPRHITNFLIDSVQPVDTWLASMCDSASCFAVRNGGQMLLVPDAPVDPSEFVAVGPSQIVANSLTIATRDASQTPTVVQVTYTDTSRIPWQSVPTDPATLPAVNEGTKLRRISKLDKPGIQRHTEAYRYAVQRLNIATVSDLTFSAQLFDDALTLLPGMVLEVTHPLGLAAKLFRVMKCESPSPGRWNVSGEEYDAAEYSDAVVTGPTTDDTTLPNPSLPPALTGLLSVEDLVQTHDGLYSSRIRVDWDVPTFPYIANYRIDIFQGAPSGGLLVFTSDFSGKPFVTPPLKELVSYTAVVHIVSTTGAIGPDALTTIIPQGKYLPPADVPGFNGFEAGGRVYLSWGIAVDIAIDTIRYEIRYGAVGVLWENAARLDRISALTWASQGLAQGTYRFLIKALDSVNMYSVNAAYKDITVTLDTSAFTAYQYSGADVASVYVAMREIYDSTTGKRAAVTDFGDGWEYGEATQRNDVGTFGLAATVVTQPHRSALMFGGNPTNGRYVSVPYVAAYNSPLNFTMEQWVYFFPVAAAGALWSRIKLGDNTTGVAAYVNASRFLVLDRAGQNLLVSNERIQNYKWTKITTVVASGAATFAIDDVPCTYATNITPASFPPNNNTGPLLIAGYTLPSNLNPLPGLIRQTKFWNKALTLAQQKISSQYPNDPTGIGGLVGAWVGNDGVQGSATTVYADTSATANNGVVSSIGAASWATPDWRSFSRGTTDVIDLGDVLNGTFTMAGGQVVALSGDVSPLIRVSLDNVTWNEYPSASVTTSGRYFQVGYEAQGGSMVLTLASLTATVLVVPRTETGTVACLTTGIQSAYLKNLYAKATDLQITPDATTGSPTAIYGVPDSIELNSVGIPGGFQQAKVANAAGSAPVAYFTFASFGWSANVTLEAIVKLPSAGAGNDNIVFDFPHDASTTVGALIFVTSSGFVLWRTTVSDAYFKLNGVTTAKPALDRALRVSLVFAGTTASLYYAGVLVGIATVPAFTSTVARTCYVAALHTPQAYLTGYIYDVRLWSVARTQQQIADNAYVRVDPATPGLAAYWKMDGNALDSSPVARNLTVVGTVTYRPVNGFDVYAFNNAGARVAANMRWRFTGA